MGRGAVRDGMVLAVERGTAREAALPGIPTAGETGTAQTGAGQDHSWFVGFAPAYDPEVAVVVVLELRGHSFQNCSAPRRRSTAGSLGSLHAPRHVN